MLLLHLLQFYETPRLYIDDNATMLIVVSGDNLGTIPSNVVSIVQMRFSVDGTWMRTKVTIQNHLKVHITLYTFCQ